MLRAFIEKHTESIFNLSQFDFQVCGYFDAVDGGISKLHNLRPCCSESPSEEQFVNMGYGSARQGEHEHFEL